MRSIYGNYLVDRGSIKVRHNGAYVDIAGMEPHELLAVRRQTIGYVSQFLRVIPRVPALDVVAEPMLELGIAPEIAREIVERLFTRLRLPRALWGLSPTTFSGGEKQRVNVARSLCIDYPLVLLDEPTSALDEQTRRVVVEVIKERLAGGAAMIGIFHDDEVRRELATRELRFGAVAA
jgi:alpha-D-ribose 1-methylphosphonate 5-triphosphate synthase subunit PhnL